MRAQTEEFQNSGKGQISPPKSERHIFIQTSLKMLFLSAFFILLSGHEAANPELGSTNIEFFCAEFRQGIIYYSGESDSANVEQMLVNELFAQRNYFPAWTINFDVNDTYKEYIKLLESAHHYGLLPATYYAGLLKEQELALRKTQNDTDKVRARVALEKTATRSAIKFMEHIAVGIRSNKDTSEFYRNFVLSLPYILNDIIDDEKLTSGILDMQPNNKYYKRLQKGLARYMQKAINDTLKLTAQQFINDTNALKVRLVSQGFLSDSLKDNKTELAQALKAFQKSYILDTTGIMDEHTLQALSIGVKEKFYQVALNLDRLRKEEMNVNNYVLVNIPEFKLHYHNSQGHEIEFAVVVGKKNTPTPELSSEINRIVANPYWTVTQNIARYEMLPRIKKDSNYLKRNGFTVVNDDNEPIAIKSIDWKNMKAGEFDYWLRQTNRRNALGSVKFLFPNKYHVYLHDTQSKRLFNKNRRAYSHGCVRVQNPDKLAQLILNDDNKEDLSILDLIRKKDRKEIRMNKPVTVHIRYFTCTADSAGTLYFHPDIYSKDDEAIKMLFENSSWN